MATQQVSQQPVTSIPTNKPSKANGRPRARATLRRAEYLWERIAAYGDANTVRDLRVLHGYLGEFLTLPESVLIEWERT